MKKVIYCIIFLKSFCDSLDGLVISFLNKGFSLSDLSTCWNDGVIIRLTKADK